MTEDEAAAQADLREIVKGLRTLCLALEGLHHNLPISPEEAAMHLGEKDPDVSTEMRRVIECGLHDNLWPLIFDFQAAASYRPRGEEGT